MNQRGVTLMELVIYLGMATIVLLTVAIVFTNTMAHRIEITNQQQAQHNTRLVVEKLTYSLRNAYDVVVYNGATAVDIYSHNFNNPIQPIITTISQDGSQLLYGEAIGSRPAQQNLVPVLEPGVNVEAVSFERISASIQLHLGVRKGSSQSVLDSTIAFRQSL